MGGMGSGLYGSGKKRGKMRVESCPSIDIREWQRMDLLNGRRFIWKWTDQYGQETGAIQVLTMDDRTILFYKYNEQDNKTIRIYYAETQNGFGSRKWFECPRCGKRKAILYFKQGDLACRTCHDLNYASSQASDELEYAHLQLRKLCKKLNAQYNAMSEYPPDKPAGMHWKRYEAIAEKYLQLVEKRERAFIRMARAYLKS